MRLVGRKYGRDSRTAVGIRSGILPGMYHVAARSEGSEADELYGRLWNIMDQGAEAGGADMSGMDSCSVGAGDRDGSGKLDGLEKIGEGVGD